MRAWTVVWPKVQEIELVGSQGMLSPELMECETQPDLCVLGIKTLGVATASVRAPVVPGWDGAGRGVRCQVYQGLVFSPHPPSPATLGKVVLLILNKYPLWDISLFTGPKWPLQAIENFLLVLSSSGKKLDPSAG